MGAVNHFKGKFHEGTFANGEGPVEGLSISHEAEEKGVLGTDDTSGRHLKEEGHSDNSGLFAGEAHDKNFDLYSKEYAGPGNLEFRPKNMGETHNFHVNK